MRKSLVICGVAALALASCTQSEVLEVNDSRAINFNAFVNKNTRAVTEVTDLSDFYVFGKFGKSENYDGTAYNNESSKKVAYWAAKDNVYKFGAYANGDEGQLTTGVSFDPVTGTNGTLKFTGYEPQATGNKGKDLVAAVASYTVLGSEDASTEVDLTFKHLLSQVKFTFKTTDADAYTIKISELKITNAASKSTCTYNGAVSWNNASAETNGYTYDGIKDIAVQSANYEGSSVEFVIPQENTNQAKVTFKATVSGPGLTEKEATFTADLGYNKGNVTETAGNTWTAGYRYNYIAEINADDIDPTIENKKIQFKVSVTPWEDADDTTVTPTKP